MDLADDLTQDGAEIGPDGVCVPRDCAAAGAECGDVPDGCGGVLSCGGCEAGKTCGAQGNANRCGEGACVPLSCKPAGAECGPVSDGCGTILDCGGCTAPEVCGGGGVANVCGEPACVPVDCEGAGAACGAIGDGCGKVLQCGSCTAGLSCGGDGVPNQCGEEACQPTTCEALGAECGPVSDGCSAVLECGGCQAPELCGLKTPNRCDAPACEPKTCDGLGVQCGSADDGCGETLTCGGCEGGETCVGGACVADCGAAECEPLWSSSCSGTNGYKVCGLDPQTGCTRQSLFISCQLGNQCAGGVCAGGCRVPELLLLADRSSSMEGPVWDFTRATIVEFAETFQAHVKLGLRAFPGESACAPGAVVPLQLDNAQAVAQALVDPSAASSTPIGGALSGLAAVLGDPTQGEHVVLMTDGSETCDDEALVFEAVAGLRSRGVTVHSVGLGSGYDEELLKAVAQAGGGTFAAASDEASLRAALQGLVALMTGCPHPSVGLAACVEGSCQDIACDAGYHDCSGTCRADDDAAACGEGCQKCQSPTGAGKAVCDAGACTMVCDPGHHLCGKACVSDTAVATCGQGCSPCPTVQGGTTTCDGQKCGAVCPSGTIACEGKCVASACCGQIGPGDLVFGEIMADPAGTDFNGDGSYAGTQDEWLELYNASSGPLELEGVRYFNTQCLGCDKHTFEAYCLPPGEAVLIFGGGTTDISQPGVLTLVSDSSLSLNNDGDELLLIGTDEVVLDQHTYTPLSGQSWVRSPEGSGPFVKHSEAPGSEGAKYSPGRCTNGGAFPDCLP
ncbi:MAG: VWA domain-containing protein [Deltaproteobacteria bacterium]|nr:VWA domain-containing protein [Deltaproteobacteria bacterium]